jgi:hypothetical protein
MTSDFDTVPKSADAPAVSAAEAPGAEQNEIPDFQCSGIALQAAQRVEGEGYAVAYIERLGAVMAQPGDLAALLAFMSGELMHGFCRRIEKALEARHA